MPGETSRGGLAQPGIIPETLAHLHDETRAKLEAVAANTDLEQLQAETGYGLAELSQQVTFNTPAGVKTGIVAEMLTHESCPVGQWTRDAYAEHGLAGVEDLNHDLAKRDKGLVIVISQPTRERETQKPIAPPAEKADTQKPPDEPHDTRPKPPTEQSNHLQQQREAQRRAAEEQATQLEQPDDVIAQPEPSELESLVAQETPPTKAEPTEPPAILELSDSPATAPTEPSRPATTEELVRIVTQPLKPELPETALTTSVELLLPDDLVSADPPPLIAELANEPPTNFSESIVLATINEIIDPETDLVMLEAPLQPGVESQAEHPPILEATEEQTANVMAILPEATQAALIVMAADLEANPEQREAIEELVAVMAVAADRLHDLAMTQDLTSPEALQIKARLIEWYDQLQTSLCLEIDDTAKAAFIQSIILEDYKASELEQPALIIEDTFERKRGVFMPPQLLPRLLLAGRKVSHYALGKLALHPPSYA